MCSVTRVSVNEYLLYLQETIATYVLATIIYAASRVFTDEGEATSLLYSGDEAPAEHHAFDESSVALAAAALELLFSSANQRLRSRWHRLQNHDPSGMLLRGGLRQ